MNPSQQEQTITTQTIAKLSIVIDKMHMAEHVDSWCQQNCDSRRFREVDEVSVYNNMYICNTRLSSYWLADDTHYNFHCR